MCASGFVDAANVKTSQIIRLVGSSDREDWSGDHDTKRGLFSV